MCGLLVCRPVHWLCLGFRKRNWPTDSCAWSTSLTQPWWQRSTCHAGYINAQSVMDTWPRCGRYRQRARIVRTTLTIRPHRLPQSIKIPSGDFSNIKRRRRRCWPRLPRPRNSIRRHSCPTASWPIPVGTMSPACGKRAKKEEFPSYGPQPHWGAASTPSLVRCRPCNG